MSLFRTKTNTGSTNASGNKQKKQTATTAQKTIPYVAAYDDGIIEIEPKVFSKSYLIPDTNFKTATPEMKEDIFIKYV